MKNNLTTEQIEQLEKMAEFNDGHCDRCGSAIKIYKHKPNAQHAKLLRRMAELVKESGVNKVSFADIGDVFGVLSQRTKMRQHGLIAKYKLDGTHVPNTWLITHKGWDFLNGKPIQEKVVVYNNQVLGHEGALVTIFQVLGEPFTPDAPKYEQTAVSEPEAKLYNNVRKPQKTLNYRALFLGYGDSKLKRGNYYDIEIEKLAVGKPVRVIVREAAKLFTYPDIAAFQKVWKVE